MKNFNYIKSGIFFILVAGVISCNNSPQQEQVNTSSTPLSTPKLHTVEIKDMQFQPAELTVNKGDTVMWINRDIVAHDATQTDSSWASPALQSGDSWKKVVNNSDAYYCSIHLVMKGNIIVD